jgi:hypothetical protein
MKFFKFERNYAKGGFNPMGLKRDKASLRKEMITSRPFSQVATSLNLINVNNGRGGEGDKVLAPVPPWPSFVKGTAVVWSSGVEGDSIPHDTPLRKGEL